VEIETKEVQVMATTGDKDVSKVTGAKQPAAETKEE